MWLLIVIGLQSEIEEGKSHSITVSKVGTRIIEDNEDNHDNEENEDSDSEKTP